MGFLHQIGLGELLVILAIVVLFFGAKRIPEIGASIGRTIRELKRGFSTTEDKEEPPTPPRALP
jgi:sec-independent protein translocase protein TatA